MLGCCFLTLCCGGSGVCYTLVSFTGGVGGACGMATLNMAANCFSAAVCF